jgi:tetratricopeptide (TPR) repeat protein
VEIVGKTHLEFGANYAIRLPPDVSIKRDYGQYSLTYHLTNNVLDAERTFALNASRLPASRRTDVESLRNVAMEYAGQSISCDVRAAARKAAGSHVSLAGTPQELHKAGTKALEKRDFAGASDALKRVVEQQPDSPDAWDELGQAYAGLNDHTSAIAAYRKQVEVNAFHKRAYNHLGAELRHQSNYEEALAAYGKQLENVPVDNAARKQHGLLLARLKHDREAIADLERASAALTDDPEIEATLALLYAFGGNQEKSKALLTSVTGSPAPPVSGDWFSAAVAEGIDPEATLTEARKIVDAIGEQCDADTWDPDAPEVSTTMYFLALEWARIGWALVLKGERAEGLRYLDSAWGLSQAGQVATRLAGLFERAGDPVKARRFKSLAMAASTHETQTQSSKPAIAGAAETVQLQAELIRMRTVKMPGISQRKGTAEFVLVFDGSSRPQRVDFYEGDADLRGTEQALMDAEYPVVFPEYTSAKIVRHGILACAPTGCVLTFLALESPQVLSFAKTGSH